MGEELRVSALQSGWHLWEAHRGHSRDPAAQLLRCRNEARCRDQRTRQRLSPRAGGMRQELANR